jgi:hypothetical protein
MKPGYVLFFLLVTACQLTAQTSTIDLRSGLGTYRTGTLDMRGLMLETEVNYTFHPKLAVSGQLGFGRSTYGVGELSTFVASNATLFWSPFGNYLRNDFRLGAGVGFGDINDAFLSRAETRNGVLVDTDHTFSQRGGFGFNLVLENSYALSERLLVGGKLFVQSYSGTGNTGLLLKVGVRL